MNANWQPEGLITEIKVHVDPNIIWPLGYEPRDSYKLPPKAGKFYRRARVKVSPPAEAIKFPTDELMKNALQKTCPRCKGRGATRRDANIGCVKCKGTGAIPA